MDTVLPTPTGTPTPDYRVPESDLVLVEPGAAEVIIPAPIDTEIVNFQALLGVLGQLSRNHLLYFRVEVGRAVAGALFGGDLVAFHDPAWNKAGSLRRFATEHREALADLGLSEALLRQCVRAYFVTQDLPPGTLERLLFSHLNLLSQLEDAASRRLLAQAAVDNGWTGQILREAIQAVQSGRWIDGDPIMPGLQPLPPEPETRPLQPGRLVTRFERASEDLDGLISSWTQVPADKRTAQQVARVRSAVEAWKVKIAQLEAELG